MKKFRLVIMCSAFLMLLAACTTTGIKPELENEETDTEEVITEPKGKEEAVTGQESKGKDAEEEGSKTEEAVTEPEPKGNETEKSTPEQKPELAEKEEELVTKEESPVKKILAQLSLEEKIAQLFVIAPDQFYGSGPKDGQTELTPSLKEYIARYPVGGFIFFAQNIKSPEQVKRFVRELKETCLLSPIIAIDEEGGRVARLARNKAFKLPTFKSMGAIGASGDVEKAREAGKTIGGYLADYGFTLDFAPDTDVNTNPKNIVIGDRAFGSDPELVAAMAEAFLDGLHSAGVKGCIKHFPGHGDTTGDTHDDYVAVTKTWEELKKCELIPFIRNFAESDCVMLAHLSIPNITEDGYPASLSKELITGRLRRELGYGGIILTDALNMGAIEKNYADGEASVLAFEAGNDILLMPNDFFAAYEAMLKAVRTGRIAESRVDESLERILSLKGF